MKNKTLLIIILVTIVIVLLAIVALTIWTRKVGGEEAKVVTAGLGGVATIFAAVVAISKLFGGRK